MYVATGGPNVKWGTGHRWRRPCCPGRIFTKCNRIRKTSSFCRCDCHKTFTLSINCHGHSGLGECLRFDVAKVFNSTLTFATFVLAVVVARFNSWYCITFFQTLGSGVSIRLQYGFGLGFRFRFTWKLLDFRTRLHFVNMHPRAPGRPQGPCRLPVSLFWKWQ